MGKKLSASRKMKKQASESKQTALERLGFTVGTRNPRLNTRYKRIFMIVESFDESELPTEDGSNGPWCIVGNDLGALVDEAYNIWCD